VNKRPPRFVPEFQTQERKLRAGFITQYYEDGTPVLWQVWCNGSNGENRRATDQDLRKAGFVKARPRRNR
jgi:hypothetical protein